MHPPHASRREGRQRKIDVERCISNIVAHVNFILRIVENRRREGA